MTTTKMQCRECGTPFEPSAADSEARWTRDVNQDLIHTDEGCGGLGVPVPTNPVIRRAALIAPLAIGENVTCVETAKDWEWGRSRSCGQPAKGLVPETLYGDRMVPMCGQHLGQIKAAATREAKREQRRGHADAMTKWSTANEAATRPLVERLLEILDVGPNDVQIGQGSSGRFTGEIKLTAKAADQIIDRLEQLDSYEHDIDRNERLAEG